MFHKPLGGKSLSQQQEMVFRKRSCEGIGIIDIKTTYWGSMYGENSFFWINASEDTKYHV